MSRRTTRANDITVKSDARKIAIYSRKSKFTGKGESIANQIELCKKKIELTFPNIDLESDIVVFEDEGYSGKNTNRPNFSKMMRDVEEGKIKAIVVYKLDRISRSVYDFVATYDQLERNDVVFISHTENFDTDSAMGRGMLKICSVFAEIERETIAERISDNMRELARSGRWLGGKTPTGYESVAYVGSIADNGKERKAFQLKIIPSESALVKQVFETFLETRSLAKTETYFLQHNIKTKNGKDFTRFTIKSMLQNPVYLTADKRALEYFSKAGSQVNNGSEFEGKFGVMAYNKTLQEDGRANKINNMADWIVAVGRHQPLISSEDWVKAQTYLEQNKSKSYYQPKLNQALLTGLVRCSHCGSYMRYKPLRGMNEHGDQKFSYLCRLKEDSKCTRCNTRNPSGNELDRLLCDEIKKLSGDDSQFATELQAGKKSLTDKYEGIYQKIESLKKALSQNEKELSSLVLSLTRAEGSAAHEHIINKINELDEHINSLKQQIVEYENLARSNNKSDEDFEIFKESIATFAKVFDLMSIQEKRDILRQIIRKIEWDGNNVHVYLFNSSDDDIDLSAIEEEFSAPHGEGCK